MKKIVKLLIKIVMAVIIFAGLFVFASDNSLKIVNYHIQSEKISGEIKLALITDLHNCLYGTKQSELLYEIKTANPDAILLGGDIFDEEYTNDNSIDLIESLVGEYRIYYVSGNHEWWSNGMQSICDYLKNAGVTVLDGDVGVIEKDGCKVLIGGIDDPEVDNYYSTGMSFREQLKAVGEIKEDEYFRLLLTHRPELADEYFDYGFDLVLAGHAHGGQFRIPYLINGLYAPDQGVFPKYAGGIYEFGNGKMIVSRGLSREDKKLPRIFNRPELVIVTIK